MEKSEGDYINYLKVLVRGEDLSDYELLLERLWKKEYYSILPNDQNREKDGILLRDIPDGPDYTLYFGPCSVLEMLIALSKRMEWEISGTDYDLTYRDLFWEILENLGLKEFDNYRVMQDARSNELDRILTDWIERQYSPDGVGGIFPIKNWRKGKDKPQNKVEIWYQMMLYLSKNYQI
jgi:hypothetical protein